jgi:DNA-binding LytR/AlgR family response regulator
VSDVPPVIARARNEGLDPDDPVVALTAEDHYVRVHGRRRSVLIGYRFGDAIAELAPLGGVQTHRSAWVRTSEIAAVERVGSRRMVRLANGQTLPLSEGRHALVQMALDRASPAT